MRDYEKNIIRLSKVSRFPDIDVEALSKAVALARRQVFDETSYEDLVTQAISNLPEGITSFERGVVSGIVLAQMTNRRSSER
jgi:hypothetical protein